MYPNELFDRLTDRSRKVLALAESQARRLGHPTVEPEHVLLGLAEERHGVAAHALRNLGADHEAVRAHAETQMPGGRSDSPYAPIPSSAAVQLLSRALIEANRLDHSYPGTEHLLLAITRLDEGSVPATISALGLTPQQIRAEVYDLLGHLELTDRERRP